MFKLFFEEKKTTLFPDEFEFMVDKYFQIYWNTFPNKFKFTAQFN